MSLYSIQPKSVESVRREDKGEGAETTMVATGEGVCLTKLEAVAVEEIDEEGEEGSMVSAKGASEEDTDDYYFEDPSNIGNYMQHTQQYSDMRNRYTKVQITKHFVFCSAWLQCHSSSPVPRLFQADAARKR